MHITFIPYGKRSEVELLLRDMEAQKHLLRMTKDGKEQGIYIQGQIRLLPFGLYEYVFPKEDADMVLTSLGFDAPHYNLGWIRNFVLKVAAKVESVPEFKKDKKFLWIKDNVNIIPIGVRYDTEITEPAGAIYAGWTHEAI